MIKQRAGENEKELEMMRKGYEGKLREQRREMKEQKKKELGIIEDFIKQENEKVLMSMEEGGRLEQIIMELYKRY